MALDRIEYSYRIERMFGHGMIYLAANIVEGKENYLFIPIQHWQGRQGCGICFLQHQN